MKITGIDTVMIDSPGRKWTIVKVHTDEGITGLGEATYSNKEPVVCAAVEHMKQELIGRDPARIEHLWHHIFRQSSLSGIWRMSGPVWMSALSGIDQALWDIKGKVAGLPLVELLGGLFRDRIEDGVHTEHRSHGAGHRHRLARRNHRRAAGRRRGLPVPSTGARPRGGTRHGGCREAPLAAVTPPREPDRGKARMTCSKEIYQ